MVAADSFIAGCCLRKRLMSMTAPQASIGTAVPARSIIFTDENGVVVTRLMLHLLMVSYRSHGIRNEIGISLA
jgi:hypothetical protein